MKTAVVYLLGFLTGVGIAYVQTEQWSLQKAKVSGAMNASIINSIENVKLWECKGMMIPEEKTKRIPVWEGK